MKDGLNDTLTNMSKRMMDFAGNNKWTQGAVMDEYPRLLTVETLMLFA